jgi:hypothetical protein
MGQSCFHWLVTTYVWDKKANDGKIEVKDFYCTWNDFCRDHLWEFNEPYSIVRKEGE